MHVLRCLPYRFLQQVRRRSSIDYWEHRELERNELAYRKAFKFILEKPVHWIRLGFNKLSYVWNIEAREFVFGYTQKRWGKNMLLLAVGIAGTTIPFIILILTCFGGILMQPDLRKTALYILFFAYVSLIAVIFFGDNRHHLPGIPLMALYASHYMMNFRHTRLTGNRKMWFIIFIVVILLNIAYRLHVDVTMYKSMAANPDAFRK